MHKGKLPEKPEPKKVKSIHRVVTAEEVNARKSRYTKPSARPERMEDLPSPMIEIRKGIADALRAKKIQLRGQQTMKLGLEGKKSLPRITLTAQEAFHAEVNRTKNPIKALNNVKHFMIAGGKLDLEANGAYRKLKQKAEKLEQKIPENKLYDAFKISNNALLEYEIDRHATLWRRTPVKGLERGIVMSAIESTKNIIEARRSRK